MSAENLTPPTEERKDNEESSQIEGSASLGRSISEFSPNQPGSSEKFKRSSSHTSAQFPQRDNSQEIVEYEKDEGFHVLRDIASFVSGISQFYNNDSLSDIVVKIGASSYKAHKFILAKSSRVFRAMLYSEEWNFNRSTQKLKEDQILKGGIDIASWSQTTTELELEETPECQVVFDKFLKFLYSGEVIVDSSTAVGILCLADKYDVTPLKDLCVLYMVEWSKSPRVHNALSWYGWAKLINLEPLLHQCSKTIAWNFSEVVSSEEWVRMDIDFLIDFLSSSELVVQNEYVLYEAVVSWLFADHNRPDMEKFVQVLFPFIRFPQLHVSQLYQIEKSHLYSMPECSKVISDLASKAYRFRAVCPNQAHLGVCFDDEFFLPRDYTYLVVDTVRIQNTLRFGMQADIKAARSPVPCEVREADWKISYRKQGEIWSLQLFCHDNALLNGETHVQPTVIVLNDKERVIQVHREEKKIFIRGSTITIQVIISQPELAKSMAVLIKPVAF